MALKTVQKEVPDKILENQEENKRMEIYSEQNPINPRGEYEEGTFTREYFED